MANLTTWLTEPTIELRFDGKRFDTWQEVHIGKSVDDLCMAVNAKVSLDGESAKSIGLTANSVIEIYASNEGNSGESMELVATVRRDKMARAVTDKSHDIDFEARSLGRELLDCQYSANYSGLRLAEIAKRLCATFKVPFESRIKTEIVPEFAMQCELPSNALINAARAANAILYATPSGGIVLDTPNDEPPVATLEYGVNIKTYKSVEEDKLRFSEYVTKSFDYASDQALKGTAKDSGITYFRPMHIVADKQGGGIGGCQRRAELERNRRQARANRLEITVQGWHYVNASGRNKLWDVNTKIRVVIAQEDIDEVLYVGDMGFHFGSGGRTTNLTVMPRSAFVGEPKQHKKRASGVKEASSKGASN